MKTTSSHITRGVIIAVSLLVLSQAWRVGQRSETVPLPKHVMTELRQELFLMDRLPQTMAPAESSVEFVRPWQRPRNPWQEPTDPDNVWHGQRQRASELLLRYDLPALDK